MDPCSKHHWVLLFNIKFTKTTQIYVDIFIYSGKTFTDRQLSFGPESLFSTELEFSKILNMPKFSDLSQVLG